MRILLDENNYIIGYCTIGDMSGSIEASTPPDDFASFYSAYQYIDGSYVLDEIKKQELIDSMENSK